MKSDLKKIKIWTIGHSTRSIEEFIAMLAAFQIQILADVRSFPGSRRYPHFNRENLSESLNEKGIDYFHFLELGGRRRARADSLNLAWRNESFRGYADYMEMPQFVDGITGLVELAGKKRTAIMCSEAVWWCCHRSLISDYLKANGMEVEHILSAAKSEPHPFTSAATIVDDQLSYRGVLSNAREGA